MKRHQAFKLVLVSTAAVALQGCVAAVVPLAAGGLFAGSAVDGEEEEALPASTAAAEFTTVPPALPAPTPTPTAAAVTVVSAAEVAEVAEVSDEALPAADDIEPEAEFVESPSPVTPEESQALVAAPDTLAPVSAPGGAASVGATEVTIDEPQVAVAETTTRVSPAPSSVGAASNEPELTSEPSPSVAPVSAVGVRQPPAPPVVATLFDPMVDYALSPEFQSDGVRPSAMLRDATSLRPSRAQCASGEPTVLIDLDPEGQDLALSENLTAPSALGIKLSQLRASGVRVAWISRQTADKEDQIRSALTRSGLDLAGNDQILLISEPDDRKQTRRDDLAEEACVIAIAGDTRSDFHELFDYLLNPDDAFALQPLIGDGWFIIPTPLLPEGS